MNSNFFFWVGVAILAGVIIFRSKENKKQADLKNYIDQAKRGIDAYSGQSNFDMGQQMLDEGSGLDYEAETLEMPYEGSVLLPLTARSINPFAGLPPVDLPHIG